MTNLRLLLAAALLFCCAVFVFSLIAVTWALIYGGAPVVRFAGGVGLTALILTGTLSAALTALRD